jgi:mannose-6-phosphate isomerase-like protein (cupin superfamily)
MDGLRGVAEVTMSSDAIIVPPASRRESSDEVRIDVASCDIAICEWADDGPWDGPPLHVHHEGEEAWHILEGVLRFTLGDRQVDAVAGTTVFVPRGVAHTFRNPGPGGSRYLIILSPDILHLIDDLHALPEQTPEAVAAVWRKHASEIVET